MALKMKYTDQLSAETFFLLQRFYLFFIQYYLCLLLMFYFVCWCFFHWLFLFHLLICSLNILLYALRIFYYFFIELHSNSCKKLFYISIIFRTCLIKYCAYLFGQQSSLLFSHCPLFLKITFRSSDGDNDFWFSIALYILKPLRKAFIWMPAIYGISLLQLSSTKMTA